jgi:hypothetical protein
MSQEDRSGTSFNVAKMAGRDFAPQASAITP